jgi:MarR family transcriptional regulator, organic hydroperoxide resistance regulator
VASNSTSTLLALQRATHATLHAIVDELADSSTGPAEANVLATLADGAPRTASELAAQVGSRPTTMTSVLDRLTGRGLIERRPHPADRRAVQIELTAAGRAMAATVRDAFERIEERALAGLDASTIASLRGALDQLAEVRKCPLTPTASPSS